MIHPANLGKNERFPFLRVKSRPHSKHHMLLAALKLQLAALVTVAGIDTADIKSDVVKTELTKLEAAQKTATGGTGGDVNKAVNDAVQAITKAAEGGDADANYAIALWSRLGVVNGLDANTVLGMYDKAAKGGNVPAMSELGGLLLQNFPQDVEKVKQGIKLIQDAEAKDNAAARRLLAQITLQGVPAAGIERDITKALGLLEKGSAAKDGEATYNLAQVYASGISERQQDGTPKEVLKADEAKALEYLKKAVEQEHAPAMNDYGARMFQGDKDGKGKDPKAAIDLFKKAADKGNAAAHRLLGSIYEQGLGEQTKDIKKAAEHYLTAARGNDGVAQLWMGNVTQTGLLADTAQGKKQEDLKPEDILINPNPSQALNFYRLAAQNGLPQAMYNVGIFYENGAVVDKDANKAFALVQRAATSGIPVAAFRLGSYYQQGLGVAQDIVAAAAWFERAAKAGVPAAQLVYGVMLENGSGVEQSIAAAAAMYENAADQGLAQAMVNLAQIYERGAIGGAKNLARAWEYASLAVDASNGDAKAKEYRDKLGAGLSKAELDKATKSYEEKKAAMKTTAAGAAPAAAPAPSSGAGSGKK